MVFIRNKLLQIEKKIIHLETISKFEGDAMSAIEYFKARKKYKQGRERQKEILKTFNRTASTNLRIDPELESERDIDFQDEKYRLKNLSIK